MDKRRLATWNASDEDNGIEAIILHTFPERHAFGGSVMWSVTMETKAHQQVTTPEGDA
jgi:hypothetical protein